MFYSQTCNKSGHLIAQGLQTYIFFTEMFNGPCISNDILIKHIKKFINYAYDLALCCSKTHGKLILFIFYCNKSPWNDSEEK